jgi:hypothetical protein
MPLKKLRVLVLMLIGLALGCALGLPRVLLPHSSPLVRTAASAGGQLLAFLLLAALAVWLEPQLPGWTGRDGPTQP